MSYYTLLTKIPKLPTHIRKTIYLSDLLAKSMCNANGFWEKVTTYSQNKKLCVMAKSSDDEMVIFPLLNLRL